MQKENEDFVVFNADTKTCHLEHFEESFPNRAYSFGIAEQNLLERQPVWQAVEQRS